MIIKFPDQEKESIVGITFYENSRLTKRGSTGRRFDF